MEMKQCTNGHFYDPEKYKQCPYCNGSTGAGVTRPLNGDDSEKAFPKTVGIDKLETGTPIPATMPLNDPEKNKTVALNLNDQGVDPIRGWVVCIEGKKKGKDYRIHSEKNYIGRARSNDISIDFDETVSREGHAVITYDMKKGKFWFQSGDGKSNVYVNDDIVLVPVELKAYDIISVGNTKLIFVPFCGEKFNW